MNTIKYFNFNFCIHNQSATDVFHELRYSFVMINQKRLKTFVKIACHKLLLQLDYFFIVWTFLITQFLINISAYERNIFVRMFFV